MWRRVRKFRGRFKDLFSTRRICPTNVRRHITFNQKLTDIHCHLPAKYELLINVTPGGWFCGRRRIRLVGNIVTSPRWKTLFCAAHPLNVSICAAVERASTPDVCGIIVFVAFDNLHEMGSREKLPDNPRRTARLWTTC